MDDTTKVMQVSNGQWYYEEFIQYLATVIEECKKYNFNVVGGTSDGYDVINTIAQSLQDLGYTYFHIYDYCHSAKNLRNHFLSAPIYTIDGDRAEEPKVSFRRLFNEFIEQEEKPKAERECCLSTNHVGYKVLVFMFWINLYCFTNLTGISSNTITVLPTISSLCAFGRQIFGSDEV
ncbi:hypothetical protein DFA_09183 [Cavenderia fasciculata]|uniref:Uncharacterized protein n=1 Tax=Cavenderia fasciculata TaxID=261658 RepID=F4Q6X5_CACFS|nr:uncharacterized protein DFA_09183 [Cavenderia fasciculata]EGG16157.1 hypothetical protein DFA_09183 [Cavenderia fasciculata]|eukprot:XP_004352610.1 hypothetical protein DFA_09183 [Cavenderia fasciculata]